MYTIKQSSGVNFNQHFPYEVYILTQSCFIKASEMCERERMQKLQYFSSVL